jgi:spore germination protein YaaH
MIRALVVASLALSLTSPPAEGQKPEALWYSVGSETSTQSFLAHAKQISIVSPQVFAIDSFGVIRGKVDPRVVAAAHANGVKLVPLVMNPGFDQPTIHRILTLTSARRKAVSSLVSLCRDNHFDGLQFDIENVNVRDKAAFTSFVQASATALHAIGCSISAAVVPRASENPGPTSYHKWIFENWRGAYDYKPLADALDFISFMTYAQHTGGTPPGPVADYRWVEANLEYVLSLGVPPSKISLGIASYSDWWYPVWEKKGGPRMRGRDIPYSKVSEVVSRFGLHPVWDDSAKSPYVFWPDAGIYNHMWIEDARAFAAKLDLVRRYNLRGYSVWVLGTEDPAIWPELAKQP